jgi:hypothetical protein
MFDSVKTDPSIEEKKEEVSVAVGDYLKYERNGTIAKTESFYCTKMG